MAFSNHDKDHIQLDFWDRFKLQFLPTNIKKWERWTNQTLNQDKTL